MRNERRQITNKDGPTILDNIRQDNLTAFDKTRLEEYVQLPTGPL